MMNKTILALLALVISITQLPAQTTEWEVFRSPEKVNDYLDMGDYFLLATNTGVSRLQKDDFSSEFWTPQNSGLPSGHIQSIALDQNGTPWIGTYDAEIAFSTGDDWEAIPVPTQVKAGDGFDQLYFLEFDAQNNLWVGTHTGLHRFDGEEWTTWNQANTGQFIGDVWDIAFGPAGEVYFVSFFIYKLEGDELTDLSQNNFNLVAYSGAYLSMCGGKLWFSTVSNCLASYSDTTWTIYPFFEPGYWEGTQPNEIRNMVEDPQGQMVANAHWGGLFRLENGVWKQDNTPQSELADQDLDHYFFDAEGNSWAFFGTQVSRQSETELIQGPIADLSVRHNSVRKVLEMPDGSILALNGSHNVDRYYDGQWEAFWTPADTFSQFFDILDLALDKTGNLWISSFRGLFKLEGQGWQSINSSNSDYPFYFGSGMEFGSNGQMWVATSKEIAWFDGQTWTGYTPENSILSDIIIRDIAVDQNDVLWVTNYQRELFRLENGIWQKFTEANSIIPDDYWSGTLSVDPQDRLWISLGTNGLLLIDGENWSIIPEEEIPYEGDPLVNNLYIHSLAVDENGWFYLARSEYLTVWDGADNWVHYSPENSPVSTYTFSMFFDSQGRKWFGTAGGLLLLQQENTTGVKDPVAPAARIARVYPNPVADNLTVEWTKASSAGAMLQVIDAAGRSMQTISLPEGTRTNQIDVSGLKAGMYYLLYRDSSYLESVKWVKE